MARIYTYYEILGLPNNVMPNSRFSLQALRTAYRRALLENHPDKNAITSSGSSLNNFTIDQITKAYSTLLDPVSREKYDCELQMRQTANEEFRIVKNLRVGIESVDLDDLEFDELNGLWFKSCRCGARRGYIIRENDLEESAEDGEICVECKGCSLCLKVLFWVAEYN